MRVYVIGFESDRAPIPRDRIVILSLLGVRQSEPVVGVRKRGILLDGLPTFGDRFVEAPLPCPHSGQTVVGLRGVRVLCADGLLEFGRSLLVVTEMFVYETEVVVVQRHIGCPGYRPFEFLNRLLMLALLRVYTRQIVARGRVIGRDPEGPLQLLLGFEEFAAFRREEAQILVGLRIGRIYRKRRLVLPLRLIVSVREQISEPVVHMAFDLSPLFGGELACPASKVQGDTDDQYEEQNRQQSTDQVHSPRPPSSMYGGRTDRIVLYYNHFR